MVTTNLGGFASPLVTGVKRISVSPTADARNRQPPGPGVVREPGPLSNSSGGDPKSTCHVSMAFGRGIEIMVPTSTRIVVPNWSVPTTTSFVGAAGAAQPAGTTMPHTATTDTARWKANRSNALTSRIVHGAACRTSSASICQRRSGICALRKCALRIREGCAR